MDSSSNSSVSKARELIPVGQPPHLALGAVEKLEDLASWGVGGDAATLRNSLADPQMAKQRRGII